MGNGGLEEILEDPELAEAVLNSDTRQLFLTDESHRITATNSLGTTGKRLLPGTSILDVLRDVYGIEVTSKVSEMLSAGYAKDVFVKDSKGEVIEASISEPIDTAVGKRRITRLSNISELFKDELTGLFNANYWMLFADEAYELAARGSVAQVIVVDVDNLKGVNDTYGHYCGDLIIRTFGKALSKHLKRRSDILTRKGGDEFYAVAKIGTEEANRRLSQFKNEVCAGIEAILIEAAKEKLQGHNPIYCGVSYGAAASTEEGGKLPFGMACSIADERMYEMKRETAARIKPL